MKMRWLGWLGLAAVLCLIGAGCNDSDDSTGDVFHPGLDANGKWDIRMDGDPLGVMTLEVSENGILKGKLITTEDATALLSGILDEFVAEFTVTFPQEAYLATVTFNQDASGASGILIDNKGFQRNLSMTPRFGD